MKELMELLIKISKENTENSTIAENILTKVHEDNIIFVNIKEIAEEIKNSWSEEDYETKACDYAENILNEEILNAL